MFVLLLATDYEGEQLLGVYSSEEAARVASQGFIAQHRSAMGRLYSFESFVISETQLDANARYHW